MTALVAQHVFREGNEWGMTVAELLENAVAEGRPLYLKWNEEGAAWDWPGGYDVAAETIVMPAIIDGTESIAETSRHRLEEQS